MDRRLTVCILLAAATLATYAQVVRFDFISWDDPLYVTDNPHVRRGLTLDGVRWAFTSSQGGNWHPMTGLSHMLDCQLYGLLPAGHHLTNVLLHTANVLLLFIVLQTMTGALWRSAFVAALFGLHPLHVESVAWVSERKDVLSTFFGFLAMWSYAIYARGQRLGSLLLTTIFLALGLMAKPMLVTLPFVLLLLDYWPLGRTGSRWRLLVEKVPLFVLAAVSSAVTIIVQREAGSLAPGAAVSGVDRAINAIVSYAWYIGRMIWPSNLSFLYPHPNLPGGTPWEPWQIAGAGILLVAIFVLLLGVVRRPYATVGWLWYLGMLVPVIGLVQFGFHAVADRYTYLPLVGLFIVVGWGAAEIVEAAGNRRSHRIAAGVAGTLLVVAAGAGAWAQSRYWRSSIVLYERALQLAPGHPLVHTNLGRVLRSTGAVTEAVRHYRLALATDPSFVLAHSNLGNALYALRRVDEAIGHYREALRLDPEFALARSNLAFALNARGDVDGAIREYREALRVQPDLALAHNNLGRVLESQGKRNEAIEHYREAVRLQPGFTLAQRNLARALGTQGGRVTREHP
jgi:hypothetical protein